MKSKTKCHHCGRSKGHVRNCIVMVAKYGIRLPGGTTVNERAKAKVPAAKIERVKFICPACELDTQRVDVVEGLTLDCQNCGAALYVAGDRVKAVNEPTKLDASDIATILAALRAFQRDWMDCDSVSIAEAWPMHFDVQGEGDEREVVPQPLGSEDIDALCERINCAKILAIS